MRRLCEERGLSFRFEPTADGGEEFVLEDTSHDADAPYPSGIVLVAHAGLEGTSPVAADATRERRRRAGKVTVRDYDPVHPQVKLEGYAKGGGAREQDVEVYEAPGGFQTPNEAHARAKIRLESLRASATRAIFRTNALALAPGSSMTIKESPSGSRIVHAAGDYFVVGVETRWSVEANAFHAVVEAIPRDVPFRLPRVTPRPRIAGVQSAFVSGQQGQEIHPDELGRVHLCFHWDVYGHKDHRSSLPVRVAQPHVSGPMLVPRIGWEVFAAFEDGDPDRPYVLGRSYNEKQPPPLPLPANKTVCSIGTDSSPGAGARTAVLFDDADGRQLLSIHAPFGMDKTVLRNQTVQTRKNESAQVGADLLSNVGGSEQVSVHRGFMGHYGSRRISVGAAQHQIVAGDFVSDVGSETVAVSRLCGEQVGNPVQGAANLLFSTMLAKIGARGTAGAIVAAGLGVGRAAVEGYGAGGEKGAANAAKMGAAGVAMAAMACVPGGEAILACVTGSAQPLPWDHGRPPQGEAAPGGGGAGASGADGGPAGPGPGHRSTFASSSYSEFVGGVYAVATPGSISWVTVGPSTLLINGSHATKTVHGGMQVLGGMNESVGSLTLHSKGALGRKVLGLMRRSVTGALKVNAGGEYQIDAKAVLTLKAKTLTLSGGPVTFTCGSSKISADSDGVFIEAATIHITGKSKQSGSLTLR